MLLALPAAVALFVIPETLMRALFERGEFTAADSAVAAKVLMGYAIGLPAYIAVKVFSTAYWSQQDTLSPVKIAIMTTALNISLALLLIGPFGVAGISIATGCVAWFQLGFLYRGLKKNDALQFDARFKAAILKIIFATLVMGGALLAVDNYLHDFTAQSQLTRILGLGGLVILGLIVYATGVITTGAIKIADLKRYLLRKKAE